MSENRNSAEQKQTGIEHSIGVCPDCKTMIYIDIGRKVIHEAVCPSCKQFVSLSPILHFRESN